MPNLTVAGTELFRSRQCLRLVDIDPENLASLQPTRAQQTAVAEMGDRGHNRHKPKRGRGCGTPFAERWEPL